MMETLKNFAKNRNTIWAVVAALAALGGWSADKVSVEAPVFKVEVTNWPEQKSGCNCGHEITDLQRAIRGIENDPKLAVPEEKNTRRVEE